MSIPMVRKKRIFLKKRKKASNCANMAKTKPLPMPVELVLNSRHVKCCGGTLERGVAIVAMRFWAAGCPASGLNAAEACQIAKFTPTAWNRLRIDFMAALAEVLPALSREYAIAQAKRDAIRARIAEGAAKGRAVLAQRRHECRIASFDKKPKLVTPDTAERYENPRAVMTPQELAAIGKKPTDSSPAARFSDK
jgi:hypothetical protein